MNKVKDNPGYVMVFVSGILWGTTGLFVKKLSAMGADTALIGFGRLAGAALMLLVITVALKGPSSMILDKRSFIFAALAGLIGKGVHNIVYTGAIEQIGMSYSVVLMYISPAVTAVISAFAFREKLTAVKISALVINLTGCLLTVLGGGGLSRQVTVVGIILGICSGVCYAMDGILGRVAVGKGDPMAVTTWSFIFATLFILPAARPWAAPDVVGSEYLLIAAGYSLVPTAMAYFIYYMGLKRVKEMNRVPVIASMELISATIIGAAVFYEPFATLNMIGISLILFSMVLTNLKA